GKMLAASNTPAPMQKQIIVELGRMTDQLAIATLIQSYPHLAGDLRQLAFSAIAKRAEGALLLLEAIEKGTLSPADLGVPGVDRPRYYPDPAVARRANEVFDGSPSAPKTLKAALVAQFREHFDQPFDRKNGKEMFKQHCAICHKLTGE